MRIEILDDNIEPYLWSNDELIYTLNDTIEELAEENLIIADQSTTAQMEIKLLSYTTLHAITDYVLMVRSARLKSDGYTLIKTTEDWLDANISDWRDTTGTSPSHYAPAAAKGYISIYPKYNDTYYYAGSSDITFVSGTKTISQATGDFSGLAVGDEINISGTTNNNGYFTLATAGTTSFTVTGTLVSEASTSAIIKKVEDTLIMSIDRLPLTPFTSADIAAATSISDVKAVHHPKLFNGMAKRLYLKPDSETYDAKKAELHRNLFEIDKKRIRRTNIILKKPDKAFTVRSGSGIGY